MKRTILGILGLVVVVLAVYHLTKDEAPAPDPSYYVILGQEGNDPMADNIFIVGPDNPIKCGEIVTLKCTQQIQGGGAMFGTLFHAAHPDGPWVWARSDGDRPVVDPGIGCTGGVPYVSPNPFQYSPQGQSFEIYGVSFYGPCWLRVQTYANWNGEPDKSTLVHVGQSREIVTYYPQISEGELDELLGEFTEATIGDEPNDWRIKAAFGEPFREVQGITGKRPYVIVETALVVNVALGTSLAVESLGRSFKIREKHPREDGTSVLVLEDVG